ncbi:phosphatidylinositol 4-kinase gamma 6 [Selaginella moellendorffii]|uniref:phosphatidylinositol 4-kinase gamma 6 n=1 Tax=Selaginella moellendorffii TaxID=88036 RepID=UPI000D1CA669|nr:phosphatidylinositol 4-kinase gamma 6 [Selaginella moellendorffii]|eukprot:XP_024530026.1 phosphatidylinositol 4-kinase gamma 6 [Selaginella moellendorffii]
MRSFQGPVQIQKPMALPEVCYGGLSGIHAAQLREVGRRRIIVQIDTGNVLGLELDRSEKVQSVKKKVQAALSVPTEQSALVFGDHVIEDDLSEVRSDTPLLLTRGLHRSSSTPCLSPTLDVSPPKDWSQPVELVGGSSECSPAMKQLIQDSVEAIHGGVVPVLATGGLGGAYYLKDSSGQSIAIVKPTDEEPFAPNNPKGFVGRVLGEPGLKRSIRVGETGVREVAAYLLDYGNFARVPATSLVKVRHSVFNVNREISVSYQGEGSPVAKIASFQQFVKHDSDASDIGTSSFPVSAVHRIGILDVRIFNTDRHGGNILVRKVENGGWRGGSFELVPIDHGLCLPETLDDPYFEWLHWPQASMPFSEEELEYIQALDPYEDAEMLRRELPMLREGCLRMLVLCTIFLKNAARSGLTLAEIGAMMSRELCGDNEELSELEKVCMVAKLQADKALAEETEEEEEDQIDEEDLELEDDILGNFSIEIDEESGGEVVADEADKAAEEEEEGEMLHDAILGELGKNNPGNGYYAGRNVLLRLRPFGSPKYSSYYKNRQDTNKLRRYFSARNTCSLSHQRHHHHYHHHHRRRRSSSSSTGSAAAAAPSTPVTSSAPGAAAVAIPAGDTPENLVFSAMSDEEWEAFLGQFEELLEDAFVRRKTDNLNFVQRLGTSCQF